MMEPAFLDFPNTPQYATTPAEIDAAIDEIVASQAKTVGIDLEWNYSGHYNQPVAVIQLCWPSAADGDGETAPLKAAVLHVAHVPGRMTSKLRALLEDGSVRKVTFAKFDALQLAASYPDCTVRSLVDIQECLSHNFSDMLDDVYRPRLAVVTTWLLGWDLSKELQTSNNWEGRLLSKKEIAYGATDAYAHLMVWRKMLTLEAARQVEADAETATAAAAAPSEAAPGTTTAAAAVEAPSRATMHGATAAPASEANTNQGVIKRRRQDEAASSSNDQPPAKEAHLAPCTEPQEHELPPLLLALESQPPEPGSVRDESCCSEGSEGAAESAEAADANDVGGEAHTAEQEEQQTQPATSWDQVKLRQCLYGNWDRHTSQTAVLAMRQKQRDNLLKDMLEIVSDAVAHGLMQFVEQPDELPLAEPPNAEQAALRLLRHQ